MAEQNTEVYRNRRPIGSPPLTDEQLRAAAPSIFAPERCEAKTSKKFHHIQTGNVVNLLREQGWEPITAFQAGTRQVERDGYQKHMIRFRNERLNQDLKAELRGEVLPELVATNAHDGTSSYNFMAGLFRIVCMNGLITWDSMFDVVRIKHFGYTDQDVVDATNKVADAVPRVLTHMRTMQAIDLTPDQRLEFAERAVSLRWPYNPTPPVKSLNVLAPKRPQDVGTDLWRTYNVAQENLMNGGLVTQEPRKPNGKPRMTREIKNIPELVRVNKGLWGLAQGFLN
jgi:uncharacterized protein DUF932